MKPTVEQMAAFEEQATAKGVPLVNLISCLPDGCDEEDTAWVLARGTTKNEARELLPYMEEANEQAFKNHAMVITLAIWMPDGDVLTGGPVVAGINELHDWSRRFIPKIVDDSLDHLGARDRDQVSSEVISARTTEGDVAKYGLPASVLDLRERYRAPGALRMIRAARLPPVVVTRPTGDAEARLNKARGNRMWGAYIDYAREHVVYPADDAARRAIFEEASGYALPIVGILQKMRSGGARDEGKGEPKPSTKRAG